MELSTGLSFLIDLLLLCLAFFQSTGFPWRYQQVPYKCPGLRQWSHHSFHFLGRLSLGLLAQFLVARDPSTIGPRFWDPIINFFQLSSLLTSEKASLRLGNGLVLKILPLTSSKFLFRPIKNYFVPKFSCVRLNRQGTSKSGYQTCPIVDNIEWECWNIGWLKGLPVEIDSISKKSYVFSELE